MSGAFCAASCDVACKAAPDRNSDFFCNFLLEPKGGAHSQLPPTLSSQQNRDRVDVHDLADAPEQRLKLVFKDQMKGYSVVDGEALVAQLGSVLNLDKGSTEQNREAATIVADVLLILCGVH